MFCFILFSILFAGLSVDGQFNSYAIETGNNARIFTTQNCPTKCRCMALVHLEQTGFDSQNWKHETLIKENGRIPARQSQSRGTDVVCSGLGHVPWGLPTGECYWLRMSLYIYFEKGDIHVASNRHFCW